jgi:flavin-dependent dehydrogenase
MKSCRALRLDLSPTLRQVSAAFEFNVWRARDNRFAQRGPILKLVYRPDFDNSLVEQNRRHERFAFFPGEGADAIAYDGVFTVRTAARTVTAPQLIGADGAYSMVNRTFQVAKPRAFAMAVEVNVAHRHAPRGAELVPCFDFGAIERGYGWIFPKDDHSSVGLYTLARGVPQVRAKLLEYMRAKGFSLDGDPLASFEGHQIPVGGYSIAVPAAPVYIVGDAGGFADALTGEGIYHALESGRLAGETAADVAEGRGTHRRYYRRLWRSVLPDTLLTYNAARLFYRDVGKAMRILEHPLVWRPFVQGYAEGATFTESVVKGGYFFTRSLFNGSHHVGRVFGAGSKTRPTHRVGT